MVCGEKLDYRATPEPLTCYFCATTRPGSISCINNHFVCDACHGRDSLDAVTDVAMSATSADPIEVAEKMMSHPSVAMIGGEHHAIVAISALAALRNHGPISYRGRTIEVDEFMIERAFDRTWTSKLPSCMCANHGACGAALAAGSVISILTDATCDTPKVRERQLAMEVTNYAASRIASFRGTCCKLSTRLAIEGTALALRDYFDTKLQLTMLKCRHMKRNPYTCLAPLCPYAKG